MTLGDMLHELRFNILRDRSDLIAGDNDSLWSDETLLRYIQDAERKFARDTLIIRDSTTPQYCHLRLKEGVKNYSLDPLILGVLSARYDEMPYDLARSGHGIVTASQPSTYFEFNPLAQYTVPPGIPTAFYTDETFVFALKQRPTLTIFPHPSAAQDGKLIRMRVVRLAGGCYTEADLDRESQIPEDYCLDVLEWAAYRAQRTFDGDAGAPTSAMDHQAAYDRAVKKCIRDLRTQGFVTIGMKYGRNGFSWVR
jgi:hypothetical protein